MKNLTTNGLIVGLLLLMVIAISSCGAPASQTTHKPSLEAPMIVNAAEGSSIAYYSYSELARDAHVVVIGKVIKKDKIINSARNIKDISEPDPRNYSVAQVYVIEVEQFIKGEGSEQIYLLQHIGYIDTRNKPVNQSDIENEVAGNPDLSAKSVKEGLTYLIFLNSVGEQFKYEGYGPKEVYVEIGLPGRFIVTKDETVTLDEKGADFKDYFPDQPLARVVDEINKPEAPIQTVTSTYTPYPAPQAMENVTPHAIAEGSTAVATPTTIPSTIDSSFYTKAATSGTIIESGYSPFHSSYFIVNQWFVDLGDKSITAYAGALANDTSKGGQELPKPWPSILSLEVIDKANQEHLKDQGGLFTMPENHGFLRIVNADENKIYLVASDGGNYTFDLTLHTFENAATKIYSSRPTSNSTITESPFVPYPSIDYDFTNYSLTNLNDKQIYLLTGKSVLDAQIGVIIKVTIDLTGKIEDAGVYPLRVSQRGHIRLVDIVGDKAVIVSDTGQAFSFDLNTAKIFELPECKLTSPANSEREIYPTPYQQKTTLATSKSPVTATPTITPLPPFAPLVASTPYP